MKTRPITSSDIWRNAKRIHSLNQRDRSYADELPRGHRDRIFAATAIIARRRTHARIIAAWQRGEQCADGPDDTTLYRL